MSFHRCVFSHTFAPRESSAGEVARNYFFISKFNDNETNNDLMGAYTKFQVALSYFPDCIDRPESAVHRLRQWIQNNHLLRAELAKTGYNPKGKSFNGRQLAIIFEYLGEP